MGSTSFIEIEHMQLALDEREGVVLADPADPAYYIAVKRAYSCGRALRQWSFSQPPPVLAPEGKSIALIASWTRLEHAMVQSLRSSLVISGERRRAFGLITGTTVEAIEQTANRADMPPSLDLAPGWLLADEKTLVNIQCLARPLTAENMTPTMFREAIDPLAEFGIIAGHGREDICYFNSFAICGQSSTANCHYHCHPDRCPYIQPKIYADQVAAKIIVLLSCGAGRVGRGLFPASCRLALSVLSGKASACLAPNALFTLPPGLVEYVTSLLAKGISIGEVARLAGRWHEKATGESDPFLVFGDPDIAPKIQAVESQSAAIPTIWQVANTVQLQMINDIRLKLIRIHNGVEALKLFELLPSSDPGLKVFDRKFEMTLGRLLRLARTNPGARDRLRKIWSQIEEIKDELERSIIDHLTAQALNGYFWLTASYWWYSLSDQESIACLLCEAPAVQETLRHPFRPEVARVRVTCLRCGIVQDRPLYGSSIRIRSVEVQRQDHESEVRLGLKIESGSGTGVLNVAVNNGQGIVRRAKLASREQSEQNDLPCRVRLKEEEMVHLHLGPTNFGVYFAKIFWVEDFQLTVASAPIEIFPDFESPVKNG